MKQISPILTILLIMLFGSVSVSAQNMPINAGSIEIEHSEDRDITASEFFSDDYFAAGENLIFTGSADDLYLMGRSINYDGNSEGGMIAFAESIEINGIVNKNLHSAGESIRISGKINETAFLAGRNIVIGKEAVVGGTLFCGGETLHIIGKLENGLIAGAGEIIIDGHVTGNVNVRTGKLTITERGFIDGNLTYGSGIEISEKERAQITGTISYEVKKEMEEKDGTKIFYFVKAFFFLSMCIGGLLLLLLPGIKTLFSEERNSSSLIKTLLWGLIPLFIYPVAVIITVPLLPLSLALALASFPLLGLTTILGLTLTGQFLFKQFKWKSEKVILYFLFAFAVFIILSMIPFIKILSAIAAAAVGTGIILSKVFKTSF